MTQVFHFAGFELDVAAYQLRQRGVSVKLERIPMEVLILLVKQAGTLVERSDIRVELWGSDVFVDHDAAINTAIRKVRQTLCDDAAAPRFVETVVGKGYRFIAPLEDTTAASRPFDAAADRSSVRTASERPLFPRYSVMVGSREFVLHAGETMLGRDPSAEVYVDHSSVSRRHARISIAPERAVLEDLGSRNGTFLNGRRVDGPAPLRDDAVIGLGAITVMFHVRRAPASTQSMSRGDLAG